MAAACAGVVDRQPFEYLLASGPANWTTTPPMTPAAPWWMCRHRSQPQRRSTSVRAESEPVR
jgi:hypothetical protein